MIDRALFAAILDDPRPGLLITGDSLVRERVWRELGAALVDRHRVRIVPPSFVADELDRESDVIMVAAADLVEPEPAARLARHSALIMSAPRLDAVPPALARRCCAIVDLPTGTVPLRELLSGSPLAPGTSRPDGDRPDRDRIAAAVIELADQHGVSDHGLEIDAARLAESVERVGGDPLPILIEHVFAPRAVPASQPQSGDPTEGSDDRNADGTDRDDEPDSPGEPSQGDDGGSDQSDEPEESLPPPSRPIDISVLPKARVRRAPDGRRGPVATGGTRGRPGRVVPYGRRDAPLALLPTLRTALPWQIARGSDPAQRVIIKPEDLRGQLRRRRTGRLTILVVDASGSMGRDAVRTAKAMAVGLLDLAYQRRDEVAIVLARGQQAVLGLAPTRSRAKAMHCLRRLPAGGGTPLASALLLAANLATRHDPPAVELVIFTDGRANVGLGGDPREDAQRAAVLVSRRCGTARVIKPHRAGRTGGSEWLTAALG